MTKDEEFIQSLRATFQTEAREHLQAMSAMLLELEKSPPPPQTKAVIESAYREAHSLKGASRAVDLTDIEAICQAVESVFSGWKQNPPDPSAEAFDALHRALDSMGELLTAIDAGPAEIDRPRRDNLIGSLMRLQSATPSPRSPLAGRSAGSVSPKAQTPAPALPVSSWGRDQTPRHNAELTQPSPPDVEKTAAQTVRIPIAKLESRLSQAEEMVMLKARAAQHAAAAREMAGSFERWWKEWAKVATEVRALRRGNTPTLVHFLDWNSDFLRSLEGKLVASWARAEQDRHAVAKRVDDLLDSSKQLLMLPFSTQADLFNKLVRDLCRDQGKEADLTIEGGEVGIDKRILEEMKDAIIHVLRNCVDHGVERPEERKRLKKPAHAAITIAVSQVNGDKVEIRISDDGTGIDVEKLKKAAVSRGVVSANEARALDDEQALSLIFHSGVSTSAIVTEISGRGLGMAIVRERAEKLGGKVFVQSRRHAGTILRITAPLNLATFRGILVSAAGQTFVMPTMNVDRVLRIKPADIQTVENRETISVQGRAMSLARLESVLELPAKAKRGDESAPIPVVVLHWADQRIAFAVDEVLGEEEVLVKPFRKPLTRVRNLAGASLLGTGKSAPVLNVADLMKSARMRAAAATTIAKGDRQPAARAKRLLVVEDSITSRTLLKGILETASYEVKTAVDGVEAFTALREEHFDLVVSDVEMPRMNGLDLTARIRADDRLAEMPVVLVTALESRQERERGIDVGANAYISKSSFDQSNLLEVVRRFL